MNASHPEGGETREEVFVGCGRGRVERRLREVERGRMGGESGREGATERSGLLWRPPSGLVECLEGEL